MNRLHQTDIVEMINQMSLERVEEFENSEIPGGMKVGGSVLAGDGFNFEDGEIKIYD